MEWFFGVVSLTVDGCHLMEWFFGVIRVQSDSILCNIKFFFFFHEECYYLVM